MARISKIGNSQYLLCDHGDGFDHRLRNPNLDALPLEPATVISEYVPDASWCDNYPHLRFQFDHTNEYRTMGHFMDYTLHPDRDLKHFLSSFNGGAHVSRKLLVSAMQRFGWFDFKTCSKNFQYSVDELDGHITDHAPDKSRFYRKFFIGEHSQQFFQTINSFGLVQHQHPKNIYNLESRLTSSFLHLVSETMATSYVPFVTEKAFYSIVTRGLFLAYAHPGWHAHLEQFYGFKKYTKIFDYSFDSIANPIERLINLMSMISKFSVLSRDDWNDLYLLEHDTIEHNYHNYFSRDYLGKFF